MGTLHTLTLELSKKRFRGGVVVTIRVSAHTDLNTQLCQECLIPKAGVLTAPIRMVEQTGLWVPTSQGHMQSQGHHMLVLGSRHGPTNNHAGNQIQTHSQAEPSFSSRTSFYIP